MPSMSLICGEFVKSLLTPADSTSRHSSLTGGDRGVTNGDSNGINGNGLSHADSDDDEEEEEAVDEEDLEEGEVRRPKAGAARKSLLEQNEKLEDQLSGLDVDQHALDNRLKIIGALRTKLKL